MSLTPFTGRCQHCGHDHGENALFDVARGTLTPSQQAKVNERFANYAKQKPHLYGGCDEITTLREQVKELKALVVMRCDLDVPPQFSQGLRPHEVLEPVTAEHCQWFVAEIEKLRKERETRLELAEQNKQLKAELKSIDGALNDPRANLTLTTSEIIWELKEQNEKMRETLNELNSWLVCAPIATAEDMAQSFAHMQQQCELALS